MGKKVFQISFKDNEREKILYDAVANSYNKSAFIKECIKFYLDNKDKKLTIDREDPQVTNDIDNIDWEF